MPPRGVRPSRYQRHHQPPFLRGGVCLGNPPRDDLAIRRVHPGPVTPPILLKSILEPGVEPAALGIGGGGTNIDGEFEFGMQRIEEELRRWPFVGGARKMDRETRGEIRLRRFHGWAMDQEFSCGRGPHARGGRRVAHGASGIRRSCWSPRNANECPDPGCDAGGRNPSQPGKLDGDHETREAGRPAAVSAAGAVGDTRWRQAHPGAPDGSWTRGSRSGSGDESSWWTIG